MSKEIAEKIIAIKNKSSKPSEFLIEAEELARNYLNQLSVNKRLNSSLLVASNVNDELRNSLRDQFAMNYVSGNMQFFDYCDVRNHSDIAHNAYIFADAMLKAKDR